MNPVETPNQSLLDRPKRADARRNYDNILTAAHGAFAEGGESTSLEEIARRADVGIGTLYRHFPNRQALLEALYAGEVEEISQVAAGLESEDPWEALDQWFQAFLGFLATKRALSAELLNYFDPDAELFKTCRAALYAAGEPLLRRAQEAGIARPDVTIAEVIQMVIGVAKATSGDPEQSRRVVRMALDGLRYQPER